MLFVLISEQVFPLSSPALIRQNKPWPYAGFVLTTKQLDLILRSRRPRNQQEGDGQRDKRDNRRTWPSSSCGRSSPACRSMSAWPHDPAFRSVVARRDRITVLLARRWQQA